MPGRSIYKKLTRLAAVALLLFAQAAFSVGAFMPATASAATPTICTTDVQGANDEPGQKDLTEFCKAASDAAGEITIAWQWDEIAWSGSNTGDACALFDTNNNNFSNYAVCVTVQGTPAEQATNSPRIYTCNDSALEKCAGANLVAGPYATTCSVAVSATDPFPGPPNKKKGAAYPNDLRATCVIKLSEVGAGSAVLKDVCSFPSQQPNSDPSDCVVTPTGAANPVIEVKKDLQPDTDDGRFNLRIDLATDVVATNVGDGGTTGETEFTGKSVVIEETAYTGSDLANYTTQVVCVDDADAGAAPFFSESRTGATSRTATVSIPQGVDDITCSFVNTKIQTTLTLVKTVVNDQGGQLTQASFPVTINGNTAQWGANTVNPGSYTVAETQQSGYAAGSWGGDCNAAGQVSLTIGQSKTCTITNNDIAPQLTVIKQVINDNSGTSQPSNFTMNVNGTDVSTSSFPGNSTGTTVTLDAGSYNVTEGPAPGYTTTYSAGCSGTVGIGETKICTVINNDIPNPAIEVVKSGPNYAYEGSNITYTFTVKNKGDTTLSGLEVIDDIADNGVYQSGDTNNNGILDKTETWVFTASYVVPTPQVANILNTVEACATDPDQTEVCDTDTHTLDVIHPGISVAKSGPLYGYQGQVIGYTFVVTNTGDTTLTNVNIDDDIASSETCDSDTLEPGAFTNCTATYVIPMLQTANVVNVVTATGTDPLNNPVTAQDDHTLDVLHPEISIVKSGPATAYEGDKVTYTFTVTTNGDIALSNVTVVDDIAGTATYVSGDTNDNDLLDPSETWIFTADYVIPTPQTDNVVNVAKACGYDPLRTEYCKTDDHELDVLHPGVNVVKTGPSQVHEGDEVTYTFTVTNTGDTPLTVVNVTDSITGEATYVSGDTNDNDLLDTDETWIFNDTYVIPTPQTKDVENTVEVCATDSAGSQVCDEDDHELDVLHPSIEVTKDGPIYGYEGQIIGYTFVVTNTGDTTLTNVGIDDDIASSETCDTDTLEPGAFTNCTATFVIPVPQTSNVINVVTASGTDPLDKTVTAQDDHELDVLHPAINIVKTGPSQAHEGDEVTYTFTVTTSGDIPLSSVTVNDNIAGEATYVSGDTNDNDLLDPSETWIFTADYVIPTPQTDNVVNVAKACGYDPLQTKFCATDDHTLDVLHPAVMVEKSANVSAANPGDTVTYTFTVTNTGDTPLNVDSVEDSVTDDGIYQSGDTNDNELLDTTETWIYTVGYIIPADQDTNVYNTVTVCATDALQKETCDEDYHELTVYAKVVVTKFNDFNRNGRMDENEPVLPDWTMNLTGDDCYYYDYKVSFVNDSYCEESFYGYNKSQKTGTDGTTTFTDVEPDERYVLSEEDPELRGNWHWSNTYCDYRYEEDERGSLQQINSYVIYPSPGETVNCFVGNYADLTMQLTKSNNRPTPTTVGDTVTYTLQLTLPETSGASFNTQVTDTPPEGFSYVAGSWTAVVKHANGSTTDLKANGTTTEPTYGSPGVWLLGDLLPGDVVTMTYQTLITSGVVDGTYPDLAFASACGMPEVEGCPEGESVLANVTNDGDTPFVGTQVVVASPQVLGETITRTTTLVNTGTTTQLLQGLAVILLGLMTLVVVLKPKNTLGGGQ